MRREFGRDGFHTRYGARELRTGDPFAQLLIPSQHVDVMVAEGIPAGDGIAGHYAGTGFPGEKRNVGIWGERHSLGAPFKDLALLRPDDLVVLVTPEGRFPYSMLPSVDEHMNPWVTAAKDWQVLGDTGRSLLTLTTSADKRRLVARLGLVTGE